MLRRTKHIMHKLFRVANVGAKIAAEEAKKPSTRRALKKAVKSTKKVLASARKSKPKLTKKAKIIGRRLKNA